MVFLIILRNLKGKHVGTTEICISISQGAIPLFH